MAGVEIWSGFSADPRDPETAALRATDTDRDHAADVLREAFADGRLTSEEYDVRSGAALGTRTIGGFVDLLGDLVPTAPVRPASPLLADLHSEAVAKYRRELREARNAWILVTTLCVAIWGATSLVGGGPYFFWPIFPSIGVGIGYVSTRLNAEQRIESIEKKLTKKQRRDPA